MIGIVNIQSLDDDPNGLCRYRVQINHDIICEFEHIRSDGLEACLRAAADAVQEYRRGLLRELAIETAKLGL